MSEYWWLFPLIMMAFCLLMMRGRRCPMMCGFGPRRSADDHEFGPSDSAAEILDKRYARGELSKEEYEQKKDLMGKEAANSRSRLRVREE